MPLHWSSAVFLVAAIIVQTVFSAPCRLDGLCSRGAAVVAREAAPMMSSRVQGPQPKPQEVGSGGIGVRLDGEQPYVRTHLGENYTPKQAEGVNKEAQPEFGSNAFSIKGEGTQGMSEMDMLFPRPGDSWN